MTIHVTRILLFILSCLQQAQSGTQGPAECTSFQVTIEIMMQELTRMVGNPILLSKSILRFESWENMTCLYVLLTSTCLRNATEAFRHKFFRITTVFCCKSNGTKYYSYMLQAEKHNLKQGTSLQAQREGGERNRQMLCHNPTVPQMNSEQHDCFYAHSNPVRFVRLRETEWSKNHSHFLCMNIPCM